MVRHLALIGQQLPRVVCSVQMSRKFSAHFGNVLHGVLATLDSFEGVADAELLGVVEAAVELQDALVEGLDHVAGIV